MYTAGPTQSETKLPNPPPANPKMSPQTQPTQPQAGHAISEPDFQVYFFAGRSRRRSCLLDVGFARGVSMPANANAEHQLEGASRLRGGGAAKVSMCVVGCYVLTKSRIAALACLAPSSVVVSRTLRVFSRYCDT